MNQRLITEIGKSQRLRVVNRLKRTQGLSVGELAKLLGMSYMGVKQHCVELERLGYLDTWRRPKAPNEVGRPQMAYRLTRKAHELFPVTSNATTLALLESAQALYGPTAAEKLLFRVFQQKTENYLAKIKGETAEARAKAFAKLRDADGYMAELERDEAGLRIVEYHTPLADLLAAYPALLQRLEQEMFGRVLRVQVSREQSEVSGLYMCVFRVDQTAALAVEPEIAPQPRNKEDEPARNPEPTMAPEPAVAPKPPVAQIPEPSITLEPAAPPDGPEIPEPAVILESATTPEPSVIPLDKPQSQEKPEPPEEPAPQKEPEAQETEKPKPPKKRSKPSDQGELFLFPMDS